MIDINTPIPEPILIPSQIKYRKWTIQITKKSEMFYWFKGTPPDNLKKLVNRLHFKGSDGLGYIFTISRVMRNFDLRHMLQQFKREIDAIMEKIKKEKNYE